MDVMLLIMILHTTYAYNIKCPEAGQWNIRAESNCKTIQQYVCLLSNDDDFIERCIGVGLAMPGTKYTINRGNLDKKNCSSERYQPFIFSTIANSNCAHHKSICNAVGLIIHNNGSIDNDRMCSCDYTQGYAFVTPPKNTCYCIPSQEDCSCYLKRCDDQQILSSDYECVQKTNIQYRALRCFTTIFKSIHPKMEVMEIVITDNNVISGMMHNTVACIVVISIAILILLPIVVCVLRHHPFSWKNAPTMLRRASLDSIENETIKGKDFLRAAKYIEPAKESNFITSNDSVMDKEKVHEESNKQTATFFENTNTTNDTNQNVQLSIPNVEGFTRIRHSDENEHVLKKVDEVKTTPNSAYYAPDVSDDKETATIAAANLYPAPSKEDRKLTESLAIQHRIAVNTIQPAQIKQPSSTLADTPRTEIPGEISQSQMTENAEITNAADKTTHPQLTEAYASNSVSTLAYVAPSEPKVPYTVQHSPVVVSSQQSLCELKRGQYAATSEDVSQTKRTVSDFVPTNPVVNKTATVPKDNALDGEPTSDEKGCNVAAERTQLPEVTTNEECTIGVSREAMNVATKFSDNINTSFKRTEDQLHEADYSQYSPPTIRTACTKEYLTTGSEEATQNEPENAQSAKLTESTDFTTQNVKGLEKTGNTDAIDPFEQILIDF